MVIRVAKDVGFISLIIELDALFVINLEAKNAVQTKFVGTAYSV